MWWHTPVITELGRQRQEDMSSRPAWAEKEKVLFQY
jgi:hypothetical protein